MEIHICQDQLEFYHQVLIVDAVDEAILGVEIMNVYGFVVNFKNNVLSIGTNRLRRDSATPVSYTHLDVYKRQTEY